MKITLDHNCVIEMLGFSAEAQSLKQIASSDQFTCHVVEIGASEMLEFGIRPERYDHFELLLSQAGLSDAPRLAPMLIFDVTFWDRCVWASDEDIALAEEIENCLFGNSPPIDISTVGIQSPQGRKWLNRQCDVHTLWCHIKAGNEAFVTLGKNFHKESKVDQLIRMGAKRICRPSDLAA